MAMPVEAEIVGVETWFYLFLAVYFNIDLSFLIYKRIVGRMIQYNI